MCLVCLRRCGHKCHVYTHLYLNNNNNKNIKLPPVPQPLPLVALFVPILLGIVSPKALAESQGVILYFSTELVGILLEKNYTRVHTIEAYYTSNKPTLY